MKDISILGARGYVTREPGKWDTYTIVVMTDGRVGSIPIATSMKIEKRAKGAVIVQYDPERAVGYGYLMELGLKDLASQFRYTPFEPIEVEEADWDVILADLGDVPQV